jgi:hypothetical protein
MYLGIKMGIDEVISVVKDSLGLEESELGEDSTLGELGANGIDVADIFFKIGLWHGDFVSDGELNKKGRDFLYKVAENSPDEYKEHLRLLAEEPLTGFINGLTLKELNLMKLYRLKNTQN